MRTIFIILLLALLGNAAWEYNNGATFLDALNPFSSNATTTVAVGEQAGDAVEGTTETAGSQATPTNPPASSSAGTAQTSPAANTAPTNSGSTAGSPPAVTSSTGASPYEGLVTLAIGNAQASDPASEYLLLTAQSTNGTGVNISGWRVESDVTDSSARIPEGARLLERRLSRTVAPIFLLPGERAYLSTGETPVRVSFRENACTGYLAEDTTYSPALTKSCPMPGDEMLEYGKIDRDDEDCYSFIQRIQRCQVMDGLTISGADLTGSCESFIENVLSYDGCVEKHKSDPAFFEGGAWRVYLGKVGELWKSTGDTLRLIDANGRVVDVLEY